MNSSFSMSSREGNNFEAGWFSESDPSLVNEVHYWHTVCYCRILFPGYHITYLEFELTWPCQINALAKFTPCVNFYIWMLFEYWWSNFLFIRKDTQKLEEWARAQTPASLVEFSSREGEIEGILKDIAGRAGDGRFSYSRFFAVGLFRLLELANASEPTILEKVSILTY